MRHGRIVVVVAALVALLTAPSGCGGGDAARKPADEEGPRAILSGISLDQVNSGVIDLSLRIKSTGGKGSNLAIEVSGPFRKTEGPIPIADIELTAKGNLDGEAGDFQGGLTLLPKRGFLTYEGVEYELNPYNYNFAKESFLPSKPRGKDGKLFAFTVCLESAADRGVAEFVENPVDEGKVEVDGVRATKVSGDLDVAAALDAIDELANELACRAQLASAGRSPEEVEEATKNLRGGVKDAHFEAYVGDDGVPLKVAASFAAEPKGGGRDEIQVDLEFALSAVDEAPQIKHSAGARSIFAWFEKLGLNSLESGFLFSETESLARVLELISADLGLPQP